MQSYFLSPPSWFQGPNRSFRLKDPNIVFQFGTVLLTMLKVHVEGENQRPPELGPQRQTVRPEFKIALASQALALSSATKSLLYATPPATIYLPSFTSFKSKRRTT
jgi:hypothetical protein